MANDEKVEPKKVLEKAEELARKPISFGEGRSHNLLGHIYFMKGLFEKVHLQQVS